MTEDTKDKKKPGHYDHTDEHTSVYGALGIVATDTPIDRAWARIYDQGQSAGPALTEWRDLAEGIKIQYFAYRYAILNQSEINVNQTVVFTDAWGKSVTESGL